MSICASKIETQCVVCGKTVFRSKHNLKKGYTVCARPAYCQYEKQIKDRDEKLYNILNKKDTTQFAYLLGLIVTDGHIVYPKEGKKNISYGCNICLHKGDILTLYAIKDLFGGNVLIRKDNTAVWLVSSKPFIMYLQKELGLSSNKTYLLDIDEWFNKLSKFQQYAFLRGVIDGDGMIKLRSSKTSAKGRSGKVYEYTDRLTSNFNLCSGSLKFINLMADFISTECGGEPITVTKSTTVGSNYYYIQKSAKKIFKVLKAAYSNITDNLVLERKLEELQKIEQIISTAK